MARIYGITKEIALTAAKLEANVLDEMKARDREENKQRKWDCFHLATAMELGCRTFYGFDGKQLNRGKRFCSGMGFGKPIPKGDLSLPLQFPEPEGELDSDAKLEGNEDAPTTTTTEESD